MRDGLRRAFAALGAPGVSEDGDHFLPTGGFFSYLSSDGLVDLAWRAGYEVARFEDAPYPHALLAPSAACRTRPAHCGERGPQDRFGGIHGRERAQQSRAGAEEQQGPVPIPLAPAAPGDPRKPYEAPRLLKKRSVARATLFTVIGPDHVWA